VPRIVVLFNLKEGVAAEEYEQWAKTTDLPTVNGLTSVNGFAVQRSAGLLMGEGDPPYQYIEIIDVNDMQLFGDEVSTAAMQKVAGEFGGFADNPCFILTDDL
jgi:hypothetical protein